MRLLENDALDPGDELHINALSRLTNETQTNNVRALSSKPHLRPAARS